MELKHIPGGVTAPKGFLAAGVHCGIKKDPAQKDVALILSEVPCAAAGVFTRNLVKAAPIYVSKEHLADGHLQGIVANSGNANACAPLGLENAKRMTEAAAKATFLSPEDFAVASTGVIGVPLPVETAEAGIAQASKVLSHEGSDDAAHAILTSDLSTKSISVEIELDGVPVRIGAIAKGSGMIHPNMGTTLSFLTTDCAVEPAVLQPLLARAIDRSFNRITVDGDTSTNDTSLLLANGLAGNPSLTEGTEAYLRFAEALETVCRFLAKAVAADGEGAHRLLTVTVTGGDTEEDAVRLARSVAGSSLVKTAIFGADANWGRILCAMGYAGVNFAPQKVFVRIASPLGGVDVCAKGQGLPFEDSFAKAILERREVSILIDMGHPGHAATCWGCDLSYDYVKINGDYRS